jgi:hypothetical protein
LVKSPRLGYYIISTGIILQVFGLAGGSWMGDAGSGDIALSGPSYVLLILGMAFIVTGTVVGSLSLSFTLEPTNGDVPRLLPLMPLVLLATVSIGSGAFAFQASSNSTSGNNPALVSAPLATPVITGLGLTPDDCPEGFIWHDVMGHCMTPEQAAQYDAILARGGENPVATPICPTGYVWAQATSTCASTSTSTGSGGPPQVVQPTCPEGFFWHDVMVHCMSVEFLEPQDCPEGYVWDFDVLYCLPNITGPGPTPPPNATPVCPTGTFWHVEMNHCMPGPDSCPVGWDYNPSNGYCQPPPTATPPPFTPPPPSTTPPPNTTPTPPPSVTPEPTPVCPAGYFWHPAMNHCMSDQCPPPLVFNYETLYCDLPGTPPPSETPPPPATPSPEPTAAPTPECPAGYFWHPAMNHCMSDQCPPPLVFNYETLYCDLP